MSKNNSEVVREGWLIKSPPTKRILRARWRKRWFTLRHTGQLPGQFYLEYYTDRNCRKLKGKIDLDQCEQVDAGLSLEQRKLKYPYMFDVKTPSRVYYLAAETEQDMNEWVDCICQVCGLKADPNDDPDVEIIETHDLVEMIEPSVSLNCIPETPPLSPISGPYIPISECVTGRPLTSSLGMQDFQSLLLHNMNNSMSYVMPLPTRTRKYQYNSATDIPNDLDPKFYDFPRKLKPYTPGSARNHKANRSFERSASPPLHSPTDSESVFTDDEWAHPVPPSENGVRVKHPSDSSAELQPVQLSMLQSFSRVKMVDEAPPRPPKPSHLGKLPNYFNLDGSDTKINVKEADAHPDDKPITDEMYDFPRSHRRADSEATRGTLPVRHCYNNAAPSTVDGQVFRYELSESERATLDEHTGNDEPPEEPASPHSQSSCSTTALYSNLPSPLLPGEVHHTIGPPVVNRGLKPGRKLSDSSIPEPSSPKPAIDRKLKPYQQTMLRKQEEHHQQQQDTMTRTQRAAPSPNPNDDSRTEQIYFYDFQQSFDMGSRELDTLQYLDLDLRPGVFPAASGAHPKPLTVYKTVDFVKTEALKSTRQHVEAERKQCSVEP